ncbi:prephenate dehydrogenase [Clostridium pasteurianum]|uniref:Prephenate dehydrogenase n=1 Tax=Clostridium pasteurianum BC1 TaxID=86416 RepID=R4K9V5_CLOPA|nr:prephenate dehydrogenase [Clostridium pasteurianum]AGK99353.1 prephenate dehydrogenase [Clostridium pasteurianum BC1]
MISLEFNITVVGLGLIGGSYAMALKELKPNNLWGIDIDLKAIKAAEALGIIDKGYEDASVPLSKSDIVIVSLYPEAAIEFIKKHKNDFKRGAVITDTSGIKESIVKEVSALIPDYVDFIGGHPMAGRESKGLAFASKDIFKNANYIITPTEKNEKENIKLIEEIAKNIGCKNVVLIDAKVHDKIIAYTSAIPHIIAVALMNCDNFDEQRGFFIGGSFRDATRVALINPDLWSELFISNKDNIIAELEEFENNLAVMKKAIENEDVSSMKEIFNNAGSKRRKLNSNE